MKTMNRESTCIMLNPIGASERDVIINIDSDGVTIDAGCFNGGTIGDLRLAVESSYQHYIGGRSTNGTSSQYEASGGDMKQLRRYKAEYLALCDFAEALQRIWIGKRNAKPKVAARKRKR